MQIELLIQKLNLIARRSPGYEVYITMGGKFRPINAGWLVYERREDRAVLIDGDDEFTRDNFVGRRPIVVEEVEPTRGDTTDTHLPPSSYGREGSDSSV